MTTATAASASAAAVTSSDVFGEYWKDDFVPLQAAGSAVNAALRADEQDADLYRRICNSGGIGGIGAAAAGTTTAATAPCSHLYFPLASSSSSAAKDDGQQQQQQQLTPPPPRPPPEQELQHLKSVPLPPLLAQQLSTVRMHSSMGLLAAADLAWMSVDDKLYLWSYNTSNKNTISASSSSSSFCSFAVPSGQCVVSVGLVRPKKGTLFVGGDV